MSPAVRGVPDPPDQTQRDAGLSLMARPGLEPGTPRFSAALPSTGECGRFAAESRARLTSPCSRGFPHFRCDCSPARHTIANLCPNDLGDAAACPWASGCRAVGPTRRPPLSHLATGRGGPVRGERDYALLRVLGDCGLRSGRAARPAGSGLLARDLLARDLRRPRANARHLRLLCAVRARSARCPCPRRRRPRWRRGWPCTRWPAAAVCATTSPCSSGLAASPTPSRPNRSRPRRPQAGAPRAPVRPGRARDPPGLGLVATSSPRAGYGQPPDPRARWRRPLLDRGSRRTRGHEVPSPRIRMKTSRAGCENSFWRG